MNSLQCPRMWTISDRYAHPYLASNLNESEILHIHNNRLLPFATDCRRMRSFMEVTDDGIDFRIRRIIKSNFTSSKAEMITLTKADEVSFIAISQSSWSQHKQLQIIYRELSKLKLIFLSCFSISFIATLTFVNEIRLLRREKLFLRTS